MGFIRQYTMVRVMIQRNTSSASHPKELGFTMELPGPFTGNRQMDSRLRRWFLQDQKPDKINEIVGNALGKDVLERNSATGLLWSGFAVFVSPATFSKNCFRSLHVKSPSSTSSLNLQQYYAVRSRARSRYR
jgi:hypothetical protein